MPPYQASVIMSRHCRESGNPQFTIRRTRCHYLAPIDPCIDPSFPGSSQHSNTHQEGLTALTTPHSALPLPIPLRYATSRIRTNAHAPFPLLAAQPHSTLITNSRIHHAIIALTHSMYVPVRHDRYPRDETRRDETSTQQGPPMRKVEKARTRPAAGVQAERGASACPSLTPAHPPVHPQRRQTHRSSGQPAESVGSPLTHIGCRKHRRTTCVG
jgi:hypothetical protein